MSQPRSLIDRLVACSTLWAGAQQSTLARLGRRVVNDSSFFARLDGTASTTTATLEKFAAYLLDPANWPDPAPGAVRVPQEARDFAHAVGVSLCAGPLSAGKTAQVSHAHSIS